MVKMKQKRRTTWGVGQNSVEEGIREPLVRFDAFPTLVGWIKYVWVQQQDLVLNLFFDLQDWRTWSLNPQWGWPKLY